MYWILLPLLFLLSCNNPEKKQRENNLRGEFIYRRAGEHLFIPLAALPKSRPNYPWEERFAGKFPRITKDFFRCKGNALNPTITQTREGKESIYHRDCQGGDKHGLPLRDGKEFIYPCLIDLLNYVQDKSGKRVVITSGHRCPTHNTYCDYLPANWSSKHMLGAEVDFYVEGLDPIKTIALLQQYYRENFPSQAAFTQFERYDKATNLSTQPWFNKEIFIKLYEPHEGRNVDNKHSYPYISLQVRFDRDAQSKVLFDPARVQNYLRY